MATQVVLDLEQLSSVDNGAKPFRSSLRPQVSTVVEGDTDDDDSVPSLDTHVSRSTTTTTAELSSWNDDWEDRLYGWSPFWRT